MKKLQMSEARTITFEQGCNMYLDNCRQRNLREGTINHYKQSYTQFYKYFNPQMPISLHSFLYVPATGCWKRVGFVELPVIETSTFS